MTQPGSPTTDRRRSLADTAVWVFDLDNTLYPAGCRLFDQVDRRMGAFIAEEFDIDLESARQLQKRYFREDGTTLRGLMRHHGTDPMRFLDYVHAIDLAALAPDPLLDAALARLPGRKLVFTNGSTPHAERVLDRLDIARHFEAIIDIVASAYLPKPEPVAYDQMIDRFAIDPTRAAMVEDMAVNLAPAHALGMATIWLRDDVHGIGRRSSGDPAPSFVDHVIADLPHWLAALTDG